MSFASTDFVTFKKELLFLPDMRLDRHSKYAPSYTSNQMYVAYPLDLPKIKSAAGMVTQLDNVLATGPLTNSHVTCNVSARSYFCGKC